MTLAPLVLAHSAPLPHDHDGSLLGLVAVGALVLTVLGLLAARRLRTLQRAPRRSEHGLT